MPGVLRGVVVTIVFPVSTLGQREAFGAFQVTWQAKIGNGITTKQQMRYVKNAKKAAKNNNLVRHVHSLSNL